MTPERLAELERLASMPRETCYLDGIDVATVAQDALAEIQRLQARWDALKDYAHHYNEQLVAAEMSRLERE